MTPGKGVRSERHPSGWQVLDDTGTVLAQFGTGSAGASAAAAYLASLHTRQTPTFDLRAWRRSQHLSLKTLAHTLGVHWITLQRWETGAQTIPPFLSLALERLEQKAADHAP